MSRRLTRRGLLAALAAAAGCAGRSGESGTTSTTTTTRATATTTDSTARPPTATTGQPTTAGDASTREEPTTGTTTAEPVAVREWPESYYRGPLVSAHEHMNGPDGFEMDREKLDWFVRWMTRNRVAGAMAITSKRFVPIVRERDDRLVPFYFPWGEVRNRFDDLADTLADRLDRYSIYEGIGEFSLYAAPGPGGEPPLPADHPELLAVYDLAAERDLPVMVHGGSHHNSYEDPEQPVRDMEAAFEHNRETTFLVHGDTFRGVTIDGRTDVPAGEAISILFDRHPNFYFDLSGNVSPYAYPADLHPDDQRDVVTPGETKSREWFESKMAGTGVDHHASRYFDRYEPILRNYSERVLWGMDASWQWHFNDWVLDAWIDVGRSMLGRLPEEHARNVAYRTAEDLFDVDVKTHN